MTGLVWFGVGIGVGVAASRRLARSPEGSMVVDAAARTVEGVAGRVRRVVDDAIADGRVEMQRREARLRAVLAAPEHRATGPDATGATGGRR